jgi:hypothetical protein
LDQAGGTVTLTGDPLSSNIAVGGQDGAGAPSWHGQNGGTGGPGGIGYGGGLCVAAAKLLLNNDTLTGNLAQGGQGGPGGKAYRGKYPWVWGSGSNGRDGCDGFGGGLCALGGIVTLTSDTIASNTAQGGNGGGEAADEATAWPATPAWVRVGAFTSTRRLGFASTPSRRLT